MDEILKKKLEMDSNGLSTYEYIANNINDMDEVLDECVENIINVDRTGQFVVSTARYLNAIDSEKYHDAIDVLIKAAITKDRDHVYLASLASSIWGNDYVSRADQLKEQDDNFRRIYKRLYPSGL